MPAYFDTGFTVREPAWHGLGHVLTDYPADWSEARRMAGLEWEPEMAPIFARTEGTVGYDVDLGPVVTPDRYDEVESHRMVRRSDTKQLLGVVGRQFEPVTHEQMGEVIEAILEQPGVRYETAGSIKDGAKTWALARLDEPTYVAGDDSPTYPYIAALNGHDGTSAFQLLPTSVRIVCWNTYQAATMEGQRHGRTFSFRHTGTVMQRVEEAKAAIMGTREEHARWTELANDLAALPANEHVWRRFVNEFIPDPAEQAGSVVSDRVRANVARNRGELYSLIEGSPTTDGHRGNALGLVDAAVEYLDFLRGYKSSDTLMGRTMLRPEPLKARAVKLAKEVCSTPA
jgi:phage/plasmid-like protein (TIGR03299 family)